MDNSRKIVAIVKTFRGEEFALASLDSIYPYVSKVIYVHSNVSNNGRIGNTVIHEISKHPDPDQKIAHLKVDATKPDAQYEAGYDCAVTHYDHDFLMLVDTDHVWAKADIEKSIEILRNEQISKVFTCNAWNYIKSPFFRVEPKDTINPAVFIRKGSKIPRNGGIGLFSHYHMEDVWIHHFNSVRKSLEEVWAKHEDSSNEKKVDKSFWIKQKWNKLPYSADLSPISSHAHTWKRVRVVDFEDLPEVLTNNEFVRQFKTYNFTQKYAKNKEKDETNDRLRALNVPEGFGPGHPQWNVPSKRNRYMMAIGALPMPEIPKSIEIKKSIEKKSIGKRKAKLLAKKRSGSVCIFTAVSGTYQWYIPLFVNRIQKEYPEYDIKVVVRGKLDLPERMQDRIIQRVDDGYPLDGHTTAALRYVEYEKDLCEYDFVLITDSDMLIKREDPTLLDQHAAHMEVFDLKCYQNYVGSMYENSPRLPGIHFVTKDWWGPTRGTRQKYGLDLRQNGSHGWEWDEVMLGKIVRESGLPLQDEPSLWANHGVHLGHWRRQLKEKTVHSIPGQVTTYMKKLIADIEFMDLVEQCGRHLEKLKETFDFFKRL